ncbi:alanine/glycine:cation symporter family protein [Bacillus sp. FJAT-42315]|uniref:alanine/glycine:cation symporter family protein n=1 Tax=Bacillus sp. FJAT-42315 TaxID=2014077 RepID=UPI001E3A9451|nr:amino acid carrier protein [Bacillus sp. FJAT-42315]
MLEKIIATVGNFLWDSPLVFAILLTGFYYTVENGLFQFRYTIHIFRQLLHSITYSKTFQHCKGMLPSFEAAAITIGSTVGIGSIGGVATAIAIGGPGAIFWMWVAAFVGMMVKMAEVTLAVHYRTEDEEGNVYGSPILYIEKGIGTEMNFKKWRVPAALFGIGIISTVFISIQNYVASHAISSTFEQNIFVVSFLYASSVFLVIRRGLGYLGKVSKFIVPVMSLSYITLVLMIIVTHVDMILPAIELIIEDAFFGTAAIGGFAGATVFQAITMGVTQAVSSGEFGWGTSPIIHSTAKVDHPVKQGLWGCFEVFFTTIILCTLTAIVIIVSGEWVSGGSGIELALHSFESILGMPGRYMVTILLFFFAFTTSVGYYFYSEVIVGHLLRKTPSLKSILLKYLKFFYAFPEFVFVAYVTAFRFPDKYIWLMSNITTAIPTIINIFVLLVLSHQFKKLLLDYKARYMKAEEVDEEIPLFHDH